MQNLDLECAKIGRALAGLGKVDEKVLTDALSVLEEQGVYACFLFLNTRGGEASKAGKQMYAKCAEFLQGVPKGSPLLGTGEVFPALQTLTEDLDKLLFAKDLLRQALVYGRYHAKASGG